MGKTTVAAEVCRHVAAPARVGAARHGRRERRGASDRGGVGAPRPGGRARRHRRARRATSTGRAALLVLDGFGDSGPRPRRHGHRAGRAGLRPAGARHLAAPRSPSPTGSSARWPRSPPATPDAPGPAALLAADFSSHPPARHRGAVGHHRGRSAGRAAACPWPSACSPTPPRRVQLPRGRRPRRRPRGRCGPGRARPARPRCGRPGDDPGRAPGAGHRPAGRSRPHRHGDRAAGQPGRRVASGPGRRSRPPATRSGCGSWILSSRRCALTDPTPTPRPGSRRAIADVTIDLLDAAQPSLIGRPDLAGFAAVDDDHETLLVGARAPAGPAAAAAGEPPRVVWSTCGRSLDGAAILAGLEPLTDAAPPIERVRYWVMRAQMLARRSSAASRLVAQHLEGAVRDRRPPRPRRPRACGA